MNREQFDDWNERIDDPWLHAQKEKQADNLLWSQAIKASNSPKQRFRRWVKAIWAKSCVKWLISAIGIVVIEQLIGWHFRSR